MVGNSSRMCLSVFVCGEDRDSLPRASGVAVHYGVTRKVGSWRSEALRYDHDSRAACGFASDPSSPQPPPARLFQVGSLSLDKSKMLELPGFSAEAYPPNQEDCGPEDSRPDQKARSHVHSVESETQGSEQRDEDGAMPEIPTPGTLEFPDPSRIGRPRRAVNSRSWAVQWIRIARLVHHSSGRIYNILYRLVSGREGLFRVQSFKIFSSQVNAG